MKQIQLITAILLTLKEFGNNKFSIFDITKKIRQHLNDGDYELLYGDHSRIYIAHDESKQGFEELWENGLLSNYDKSFNSQGYREYQLNDVFDDDLDDVPTPKVAIDDIKTVCANSVFPVDFQKRMYYYIKHNTPVTMKQIQSRFKGEPYTCKEIRDFLSRIGLVDPATNNYPDSQVKTLPFN